MALDSVTGALIETARETGAMAGVDPKTITIRIDVTGGLGAGPADALRSEGYAVVDVNSSSEAIETEQYPNRRSELWFVTRERARTKDLDLSRLSPDLRSRLERELSTPKWKPDSRGRRVVEKKDEIKKRLGASPDLADALNLAFVGYAPAFSAMVAPDDRYFEYRRSEDGPADLDPWGDTTFVTDANREDNYISSDY